MALPLSEKRCANTLEVCLVQRQCSDQWCQLVRADCQSAQPDGSPAGPESGCLLTAEAPAQGLPREVTASSEN